MGCRFVFPGDLPDPGIEPRSPALQADSLASKPPEKPTSKRVKELEGQEAGIRYNEETFGGKIITHRLRF